MRVGLFLGMNVPEEGGGYTFETEVYQSLLKFGQESNHTFIVLTWGKGQPPKISTENIQFLSLYQSLGKRMVSKLSRTATGVFKKLRHPGSLFTVESRIEKLLFKYGIEFIWYLTPDCFTMEIPYITVVFDLQHRLQPYFPEVSTKGQWNWRERFYGTVLRRAAAVITGTEAGKAEIEYFYQVPKERIKILPHPTPAFALNAAVDDGKQILVKYSIPENYLFYPAQFWPHKNHMGLLQAVRLLRDKYQLIFPVVFVGSDKGNQSYIRQRVAELGLSAQIHFLGFVPQEDLISLYRKAFALTYLTFFGPENLPPLEAFALGCPVVASQVSGAREQLGEAALLVDPKDPEQIALAIKSLYEGHTLRHTLIQRGLERALQWTGEDYVKGVFSILDEFEPIRWCWK